MTRNEWIVTAIVVIIIVGGLAFMTMHKSSTSVTSEAPIESPMTPAPMSSTPMTPAPTASPTPDVTPTPAPTTTPQQ
jgi:hypothetical protein